MWAYRVTPRKGWTDLTTKSTMRNSRKKRQFYHITVGMADQMRRAARSDPEVYQALFCVKENFMKSQRLTLTVTSVQDNSVALVGGSSGV